MINVYKILHDNLPLDEAVAIYAALEFARDNQHAFVAKHGTMTFLSATSLYWRYREEMEKE